VGTRLLYKAYFGLDRKISISFHFIPSLEFWTFLDVQKVELSVDFHLPTMQRFRTVKLEMNGVSFLKIKYLIILVFF